MGAGEDPVSVVCPGQMLTTGQAEALLRCKAELWPPFPTQLCKQRQRAGSVGQEGFGPALNCLYLGWSPPRDKNNGGDTIG